MTEQEHQKERKGGAGRIFRTTWLSLEFIAFHLAKALGENVRVIRREVNLFLGSALSILGLLNWSTGKYCDGNTADYLSCTRPTAYYYYGWFSITLILVGVTLLLVWYVRNRRSK